ncbi:hypothetical protein [Peribacillus muralis]|uniref:hypothetical protein n=1 Tax=Peribacillus muralis TaxID=264697 RepID=UPI00070C4929|nr:hypothetical protein [Peribacillus muralis]
MLKIDRSAVDSAIETLDTMFTATQEVLADYETEKQVLVKRGEDFSKRVAELQEEHTQLLLDREISKDNTGDYIYLSKQLTSTDEEMKIILSLQEQLKEDFTALKMKYAPIIQATYRKDLSAKNQLPVNEMVEHARYELVKAIYDFASEVRKQQSPLLPAIGEFLDDKEVMEVNRNFERVFEYDQTNLPYSEFNKTVIHRLDIFSACSGNMPTNITKPKGSAE